jgi:hypothetical protein
LTALTLGGTKVTDGGVANLRVDCPKLKISR